MVTVQHGHVRLVLSHYPMNAWKAVDKLNFNRSVQGVLSLLLALRQRPYVRYAAHSEATQVFARAVVGRMKTNKELFDFRKRDGGSPLLVLMRASLMHLPPPPPPLPGLCAPRRVRLRLQARHYGHL